MDLRALAVAFGLALTPALARADTATGAEMGALDLNGFHLVDAEYLPFVADAPLKYPDDVLWGFYPDGASAEAKACALKSYKQLRTFFQNDPAVARGVLARGGTALFYLWINDYTQASLGHEIRPARLQHWPYDRDYRNGSWKWVASVAQDGSCTTPDMDDVEATLESAYSALGGAGPE